jgi:hypothetical protein
MEKVKEFIKTYKIQLLVTLILIFSFRSCSNSRKVDDLEKLTTQNERKIDSLESVTKVMEDSIKSEKIKIHTFYDNWISEKNRSPQLMELHFLVKNNLKELQQSK